MGAGIGGLDPALVDPQAIEVHLDVDVKVAGVAVFVAAAGGEEVARRIAEASADGRALELTGDRVTQTALDPVEDAGEREVAEVCVELGGEGGVAPPRLRAEGDSPAHRPPELVGGVLGLLALLEGAVEADLPAGAETTAVLEVGGRQLEHPATQGDPGGAERLEVDLALDRGLGERPLDLEVGPLGDAAAEGRIVEADRVGEGRERQAPGAELEIEAGVAVEGDRPGPVQLAGRDRHLGGDARADPAVVGEAHLAEPQLLGVDLEAGLGVAERRLADLDLADVERPLRLELRELDRLARGVADLDLEIAGAADEAAAEALELNAGEVRGEAELGIAGQLAVGEEVDAGVQAAAAAEHGDVRAADLELAALHPQLGPVDAADDDVAAAGPREGERAAVAVGRGEGACEGEAGVEAVEVGALPELSEESLTVADPQRDLGGREVLDRPVGAAVDRQSPAVDRDREGVDADAPIDVVADPAVGGDRLGQAVRPRAAIADELELAERRLDVGDVEALGQVDRQRWDPEVPVEGPGDHAGGLGIVVQEDPRIDPLEVEIGGDQEARILALREEDPVRDPVLSQAHRPAEEVGVEASEVGLPALGPGLKAILPRVRDRVVAEGDAEVGVVDDPARVVLVGEDRQAGRGDADRRIAEHAADRQEAEHAGGVDHRRRQLVGREDEVDHRSEVVERQGHVDPRIVAHEVDEEPVEGGRRSAEAALALDRHVAVGDVFDAREDPAKAEVAQRDPVVEREDVELALVDVGGDVEAQAETVGRGL